MPVFINQSTGFPDETPCPGCGWPMYCCLCQWEDDDEAEAKEKFAKDYPDSAFTWDLNEHPQGWDKPCMCADCRSYGD